MATNSSWSIDDSRNKFQFGCEYGRLIENGELDAGSSRSPTTAASPPRSGATSWASATSRTFQVLGTPNCGKGEPNQMIRVGHASPVCLFADVEVFGGA